MKRDQVYICRGAWNSEEKYTNFVLFFSFWSLRSEIFNYSNSVAIDGFKIKRAEIKSICFGHFIFRIFSFETFINTISRFLWPCNRLQWNFIVILLKNIFAMHSNEFHEKLCRLQPFKYSSFWVGARNILEEV